MDSLYTNIDTTEGIKAVKDIFLQYPHTKRPDEELLQLLEINLTRNDFEFNNKFYLQVKGTTMGKEIHPDICQHLYDSIISLYIILDVWMIYWVCGLIQERNFKFLSRSLIILTLQLQ